MSSWARPLLLFVPKMGQICERFAGVKMVWGLEMGTLGFLSSEGWMSLVCDLWAFVKDHCIFSSVDTSAVGLFLG